MLKDIVSHSSFTQCVNVEGYRRLHSALSDHTGGRAGLGIACSKLGGVGQVGVQSSSLFQLRWLNFT